MSNQPHGLDHGDKQPHFVSWLESTTSPEQGPSPTDRETGDVIPETTTVIENQVLQIWAELRRRWRAGDPCDVKEYLVRNPDLAGSEVAAVDLIYAEYLLWEETGKSPCTEDFLLRFPRYADALRRQFEVHAVLSSEPSSEEIDTDFIDAPKSQFKIGSIPGSVGKYRIIESLGRGGQAEVYRAIHPTLGKDVVLKIGRPKSSSDLPENPRLMAEGRILAEIEHPNLARIYDLDFDQGRPFLVMEYLRGSNLAQYAQQHRFDGRTAAILVAKIARAVGVVHRRGVLHLDIKPLNIALDEQGNPKLLDFGLARWETLWRSTEPECEGLGGTLAYMAPEQASGEAQRIGPRSDVFALGAVLFYLLVGQPPNGSGSLREVWDRAKRGEYDRAALRDKVGSKRLQRICTRALAATVENRYPSADALAADLESFACSRRGPLSLTLAAIVAVAIAVTWFLLANRRGHESPNGSSGTSVAVDRAAEMTVPTLAVRILRKQRYFNLADAVPVRTGDKLQISAHMPAGIYGTLLLLGSDGHLQTLAKVTPSEFPQTISYPTKADEVAPLVGAPGTELLIAVGWRNSFPDLRELTSFLGDGSAWPALPPDSVLRLAPSEIAVEQISRNLGNPEMTADPEGQVRSRLEDLRTRLSGKCETFAGFAFSHRP